MSALIPGITREQLLLQAEVKNANPWQWSTHCFQDWDFKSKWLAPPQETTHCFYLSLEQYMLSKTFHRNPDVINPALQSQCRSVYFQNQFSFEQRKQYLHIYMWIEHLITTDVFKYHCAVPFISMKAQIDRILGSSFAQQIVLLHFTKTLLLPKYFSKKAHCEQTADSVFFQHKYINQSTMTPGHQTIKLWRDLAPVLIKQARSTHVRKWRHWRKWTRLNEKYSLKEGGCTNELLANVVVIFKIPIPEIRISQIQMDMYQSPNTVTAPMVLIKGNVVVLYSGPINRSSISYVLVEYVKKIGQRTWPKLYLMKHNHSHISFILIVVASGLK